MGRIQQFEGVRAISSSTIQINFYYAGKRQRENIKLEPTPANLKRAYLHRAAILEAIKGGTFDYAATFPNSKNATKYAAGTTSPAFSLLLVTYLEGWLEGKRQQLKASTWDDYRKIVDNFWIPHLGNIGLAVLKRADVKNVVKTMKCSNKRIANVLSVLRAALEDAVHEEELIEVNPLVDWSYRNREVPKEESDVDPFTVEEQAQILEHCFGQYKNFVQFALWTGLRTSELVALDWRDIDWERGVIMVTRAWTEDAQAPESTKTESGKRDVKLLEPALAALKAQKAFTFIANAEIFQNPRTLKRWSGDQVIRKGYWIPALKEAGIRYRRPYQTRHTYASMMLSAGEHPMWVAQQMGHQDWGMIRRIYGKFMKDTAPDAGGMAVAMFAKNQNGHKMVTNFLAYLGHYG